MFGGDDPFGGEGPGGLFAQFAQQFGGGVGPHRRRPPQQYDEYLKAYSVAMLPGKERANVSYGGKIILPQSALASLTALDLESPWMFKLSNPQNPAAFTHAGVLEFIAEEGVAHLPYWMMKSLRLNEGDPLRITGAELPKGKFVKLQAQHVHFLEISDPKAVLEQALRNFSALTQGDIIEISYNNIIFELLIMETVPGGSGISVLDTDLEVDFAAPVGYVEPERPKAAPPPTMASKLKIDLNSSTPGSSRPSSALSGAFAGTSTGQTSMSKGGDVWESFKGKGETLSGRKTKGRGISQRKIEDHMEGSHIYRTNTHRIVSNDTLDTGVAAPAPLVLPPGKLFFGFKVVPYVKPGSEKPPISPIAPTSPGSSSQPQLHPFSGSGNTLSGRPSANGSAPEPAQSSAKGKGRDTSSTSAPNGTGTDGGRTLAGGGQVLGRGGDGGVSPLRERFRGTGPGALGAGGARAPPQPKPSKGKQRQRSPTPDWGVDDDDVIVVDSD